MTATLKELPDSIAVGGLVGLTNTLDITEARDTASIAGVGPKTAVVAALEQSDAATIAGRNVVVGGVAAAEAADVVAVAGTIIGQKSATLQLPQWNDSVAVIGANLSVSPPTGPLGSLAVNTARNLGPYWDPDPQWTQSPSTGVVLDAQYITDYSGMAMDAVRNRVVMQGGGHGFSQQANLRIFDLATLAWSNLFPSIPAVDMINHPENIDIANGRWTVNSGTGPNNQPTARHTYNMTLVRGNDFLCMTPRGMPFYLGDAINSQRQWGGRNCRYSFTTGQWTYGQFSSAIDAAARPENVAPYAPWSYQAAACLDPSSNKVLVAGSGASDSGGGIWLYNPDTDTYVTGPDWPDNATVNHGEMALVYFPPNDKFYAFSFFTGTVTTYEITINRSSFNLSTISAVLPVTGFLPVTAFGRRNAFAYDSVNGNIGGTPTGGTFYQFAPTTRVWTATAMLVEAGSVGTPNMSNNSLVFDPGSGCYIFLDNEGYGVLHTTWAYRPPGTGGGGGGVVGVADLSVALDFGGGSVATFNGSDAVDKGDYVGEFVRQKSYLCTNAAFPDWKVWFRVDAASSGARIAQPATGWRDEVVIEYGRTTSGTPVHRTTSYVATVKKSGATVYSATVPQHFARARWRYQSSQRSVVRTPAILKSRKWIMNFGANGLFGTTGVPYTVTWPGPMGAPVRPAQGNPYEPNMGTGGDHDEIGYLTESGAAYMIFEAANALTNIRTDGEYTGNWCMHLRDDANGNMPSFRDTITRPESYGGTVKEVADLNNSTYPNFVTFGTSGGYINDGAHWYASANAGWLLFDDPFLLEALQFGVNHRMLWNYVSRANMNLGGLLPPLQDRSLYWGLRDLFLLALTTPATTPAWLKNRAHWQDCLDDNLAFVMQFVNSTARIHALFRAWPRSDASTGWQSAWGSAVLGWAVSAGFTAWTTAFNWSIGRQIAMTNGTSGWNKQWPSPYIMSFVSDTAYYNANEPFYYPQTAAVMDAHTCASWAAAWTLYKTGTDPVNRRSYGQTDSRGYTIDDSSWNGHTIMAQFPIAGYSYAGWHVYELDLRSALAVAQTLGVSGAAACYSYLQTEMTASFPNWGGGGRVYGQCRMSIDP